MAPTEQFLDLLIDNSPVSIQVCDRDGATVRVNGPFLRLFGVPDADQVVGTINVRTNPIIREHGLIPYIERAYAGETVHTPAVPWRSDFGPPREIRATIFPVFGPDRQVENVVLVHEDVTELEMSTLALKRRYHQTTALQNAYRRMTQELDTGAVLRSALQAMDDLLVPDAAAIWWLDQERDVWRCAAARGLSEAYQHDVEAFYAAMDGENAEVAGTAVREDRPVAMDDAQRQAGSEELSRLLKREGLGRLLAVPLKSGESVAATMAYYYRKPGPFDPSDIDAACLLAGQSAVALHNAQLYESAKDAAEEASLLSHTAAFLTQSLSLPDVMRSLTEIVAPLMGLKRVAVYLVDQERDEVTLIAYTGLDPDELSKWGLDKPQRLSEQNEVTRHMVETGEPIVLDELPEDLLAGLTEEQRRGVNAFQIRSILVVPLRDGNRTIGYISFDNPGTVRHWTERDLRLARGVAGQAGIAIRNARLFEETEAVRAQLEERVRERTEELRAAHTEVVANERLAAIGFMAKEVAHSLRNPLNVIATSAYYLKSRFADPDEKVQRHFDTIARYIDQSANTINQLTNLAGAGKPNMAAVDLNRIVMRALHDRATPGETPWKTDWDANLPYVRGDWTQLSHAVKALLGNITGLDGDGDVQICTSREGDTAVLAVGLRHDTLPEEERSAIFGPFFTSTTQWTGLGLSVARQIARRHNGDLTADQKDGFLWFRMTLPLFHPDE